MCCCYVSLTALVRRQDAKNFWKSLDHQAISLKANDKRTLTAKSLVTEIETLKREQRQRSQVSLLAPSHASQLRYTLSDVPALADAIKLVLSFLDRTAAVTSGDKDRLDAFLRQFLPLVFALSSAELGLDVAPSTGLGGDDDLDSVEGMSDAGLSNVDDHTEGTVTPKRGAAKKAAGDLRKKALKNAVGPSGGRGFAAGRRSKVSSPAPSSRAASPASAAGDGDSVMADVVASASSVLEAMQGAESDTPAMGSESEQSVVPADAPSPSEGTPSRVGTPEPTQPAVVQEQLNLPELIVPVDDRAVHVEARRQWNAFANSNLYCLVRLLQVRLFLLVATIYLIADLTATQIVYHRLTLLKSSAVALTTPPNPEPISERHVPSLSLSLTIGPNGGRPNEYYQRALGLCERLFDGDVDQQAFEEGMRGMFGTQGYMLFTVDKLCMSIVKHVRLFALFPLLPYMTATDLPPDPQSQAALADAKSQELLELLVQDRAHPDRSTPAQQKTYRTQAEGAVGNDENLYRFAWAPASAQLSIQLVGKDSVPADDLEQAEREWAAYLERFVLAETTPGIGAVPRAPFLRRCVPRLPLHTVDHCLLSAR